MDIRKLVFDLVGCGFSGKITETEGEGLTVRFDGREYMAVTNVGNRPTVNGHHVTVEPWILDFSGDLYGKTITLEFHKFLRPERKFDSLEELKAAIAENARQTREYFN